MEERFEFDLSPQADFGPEKVWRVGIMVAMDKELELLKKVIRRVDNEIVDDKEYLFGYINDIGVIIVKSGIGKVNAALTTQKMIDWYSPNLIINTGVAGGLDESVRTGDVVVPDSIVYHDVWCGDGNDWGVADCCPARFIPYERCIDIIKRKCPDVKSGLLCTGDRFIKGYDNANNIKKVFGDGVICDMEGAAIAHTCHILGVPFVSIKVVSDNPMNGDNVWEYDNFWSDAPEHTFNVVKTLIENL